MFFKWALSLFVMGFLAIVCSFIFYKVPKKQNKNFDVQYLRIVSLAPSFSETVEKLGQSHRLVGITIHCNIKEADSIPKIGSFAQINLEAILALKPDLVLAVPHVLATPILKKLAEQNIEIFAQQPDSIKDIENITLSLARKFNVEKTGEILVQKIRTAILEAKEAMNASGKDEEKKKFILAVSSTPLVVASAASFPSEILEQMGFINSVQTKSPAWPIWPLENIITSPPDLIIFSEGQDSLFRYQNVIGQVYKTTNKIKLITPKSNIFSSPSPKIIKDIKYFVELLKQENNHAI